MSVNVDTVYQRVLALANKEQRGYITPQEFNLLANQAQLLIFEQYFYDLEKAIEDNGNSTEYSDRVDVLSEKIAPFEKWKVAMSAVSGNEGTLPTSTAVHKLGTVFYAAGAYDVEVERVEKNDLHYMERTALAAPTDARPVYVRKSNSVVKLFPSSPTVSYTASNVTCNYIAKPAQVIWNYTVANNQALYNSTTSIDFELHESEEIDLVYKILEMAGIVLNKPGLVQIATNEETALIAKKQ
tara:strand:+ start:862 stop:1584 length:723 start_codon:yes stop_codon:yes gene_type:complete